MAVAKSLPTLTPDGSAVITPSRTGSYLEAYVIPLGAKQNAYAEEGSYFSAYNVTDGTGIAGHAAPVQSDLSLKPLLHIFNASTTKSITLDFIRVRLTAIGAGATTCDVTTWVDRNGATVKTSGGTVATVVNCNGASTAASAGVVSFGAVVATAGTGEVRIDHQRVRSVVPVVEDQYIFQFGASSMSFPSALSTAAAAYANILVPLTPAVIGPGGNFKLAMWGASQSGAHSLEYTVGYWER